MIEQLEDKTECGQIFLFDGSIIVALEGLANDLVDFPLRCQQVLLGPGFSNLRDHGENAVAVAGIVIPFVSVQVATQPGGGRSDPGKKKQREPEVVAVLIQEGPLCAVDDRRGTPDARKAPLPSPSRAS